MSDAPQSSRAELAWARRTKAALLLQARGPAGVEQALRLIDENIGALPGSAEDRRLKATILASRQSGRGEALEILDSLASRNELDRAGRFLLAQLDLQAGREDGYRAQMNVLTSPKGKEHADPQQLAHYIHFLASRKEYGRAESLLGELRRVEPEGLNALEAQAALLKARKQDSELLTLLQARGRETPGELPRIADLLNRYGFTRQAEQSYKTLMGRETGQSDAVLALASLLAKQDRVAEAMPLLEKSWSTGRPDQVAYAALELYDAPSITAGQRHQVEDWVAEAARRLPARMDLQVKLSGLRIRQGRFQEAEALVARSSRTTPRIPKHSTTWHGCWRCTTGPERARRSR